MRIRPTAPDDPVAGREALFNNHFLSLFSSTSKPLSDAASLRAIMNTAGRIGGSGLRPPRVSETGGRSEFHLVGLRNWNEALIEVILIVLGADHFVEWHFLPTLIAPVTLTRVPWHRECTGVLNMNPDVQRLAAIDQLEALHDVELGRVGRTEIVDISPVVKVYGVDHQRVTVFIMPDGFAVPRRLRIGGVGYVQVDVMQLEVLSPNHHHFVRRLNKEYRVDRVEQKA